MQSSKIHNRAETFFGLLRMRSLYVGLGGASLGLIIIAVFRILNIYAFLGALVFFFIIPAVISEFLYKGSFEGEAMENLKHKILQKLGIFKERLVGAKLAGAWRQDSLAAYNDNSIYNAAGDETICFKIIEPMSQDSIRFLTLALYKCLPPDCQVTTVRFNSIYTSDYLIEYRPRLLSLGVNSAEYYVFIKIPAMSTSAEERVTLMDNLPQELIRMNRSEVNAYVEKVVDPYSVHTERPKPIYQTSLVTDGRYAYPYADECYGVVSLCELPDDIRDDFHEFYLPALNLRSVVSSTLIKVDPRKNISGNVVESLRVGKIIGFGGMGKARKEAFEKKENDREAGDYGDLIVYSQALIFGKRAEVDIAIKAVKAAGKGTENKIDSSRMPLFMADLSQIEKAISAVLPGKLSIVDSRAQDIKSFREAVLFTPTYAPPLKGVEYPMVLRTSDNMPAFINHAGFAETPLTLFVGKSGLGKSTMMNYTIYCHYLLGKLQNRPVSIVVGDVGSSMEWMIDTGLADLAFNMERRDGADFSPLPIHPLHAFLSKGTQLQTPQKLLILEFVSFLIGSSTNDSIAASAIDRAVSLMVDKEEVYSLTIFKSYLEKAVAEELREVPGNSDNEAKLWHGYLKKLGLYCKGGIYGQIFDPEHPTHWGLEGVVNFYYNLDEEVFMSPELARAYIGLSFTIARVLGDRYKSQNEDARDVLLAIDEWDRQSAFLNGMSLKTLKDQARKYGMVPAVAIQSFDYLTTEASASKGSQNTIYEGVGNTFFYGVGQEDVFPKVAAIFEESYERGKEPRGKLAQMVAIAQQIPEERKKGVYSVGFFDRTRVIQKLFVDLEKDFLWMTTTHPGGRAIRNAVRRQVNYDLLESCRLLAAKGPWPIPSETPSPIDMKQILANVKSS